jgi:hypothetical protein
VIHPDGTRSHLGEQFSMQGIALQAAAAKTLWIRYGVK